YVSDPERCHFFRWHDPVFSQYITNLLGDLRDRIDALQNKEQELNDSLEGMMQLLNLEKAWGASDQCAGVMATHYSVFITHYSVSTNGVPILHTFILIHRGSAALAPSFSPKILFTHYFSDVAYVSGIRNWNLNEFEFVNWSIGATLYFNWITFKMHRGADCQRGQIWMKHAEWNSKRQDIIEHTCVFVSQHTIEKNIIRTQFQL
ncbi:hypothetical protein ACJX0J_041574, partial [Zea mays]